VVTSALVGVVTDLVVSHNTEAVVDGRYLDGGLCFILKARIGARQPVESGNSNRPTARVFHSLNFGRLL
jgi:hypothetical protein